MEAHVGHVLIVDDDRDIRELVSSYLTKNSLCVTMAPDGRHMRQSHFERSVDLLIIRD